MNPLSTVCRQVRAVFGRNRIEHDMDREMQAHLDLLAEEYEESGLSPDHAWTAAKRRFGNLGHLKDLGRDVRGPGVLGDILRDARYALRGFGRTPGFTTATVLTLALGIGANAAIFSIVDRLLLRDLPYPSSGQLMAVYESIADSPRNVVSPANWMDWQNASRSFSSLAAWNNTAATLTSEGEPEPLNGQVVSAEFFPLLGVEPVLGRVFTPEEDRPGSERVVILSHGLWQRRFGGDLGILGRSVELNAAPYVVIGVMPPDFRFIAGRDFDTVDAGTDYWMPYALDRNRAWRETAGRFMSVVGRLRQGVTPEAAQSEMSAVAELLAGMYGFNAGWDVAVVPLREDLTRDVRTSLLVLFAAVGALVLLACFNVAGLLLARGVHRRQEMAIRVSLGASRWTIARQLLTESVLLALAGAGLGLLVSRWTVQGLVALAPLNLMRVAEFDLDGRVLLYTLGLGLATAIVSTLAPTLTSGRESLATHLSATSRTVTRTARLRQALVVAQVALTLVLLSGAGLLGRSLLELLGGDNGVDATNVLSFQVGLPSARYTPPEQTRFFGEVLDRLEDLPGVVSAGAERSAPITGPSSATAFHIQGTPELPPWDQLVVSKVPVARIRVATPGYFRTLGIPILRGRDLSPEDQREDAPIVFVVNEAFARWYFPEDDPLDAVISVLMSSENPYGRIVGVVGDVKEGSLRSEAEPTIFYDNSHLTTNSMVFFVRANQTAGLPPSVVQVVRELDADIPVTRLAWLEDLFADSVARDRMNAVVLGAFALTALALASFGLYGLLAYLVADRTREIGIRMALGARSGEVLRMVIHHGLRLVIPGAVLGLAGAFALSRTLESLLYGVTARDPATLTGGVLLLLTVSLAAIWIPARRATRVDPLVALREE